MTSEREIYERIVQHERSRAYDASTEEMLTLGLIHYYKWDKVLEWEKSNSGEQASLGVMQAFLHQNTELDINDRRCRARDTLRDYATRFRKWEVFWSGVWRGMVASFFSIPYFSFWSIACLRPVTSISSLC